MPQTPVTDTIKINTTVAGAQFAPAIAVLSGGGYVIVWHEDQSGRIYAQRFSATGQPVGAELQLDSVQGGAALWVSVAATAADGFVIAFQAGFGNNSELYARRYDSLNNPVGGLFQANTTSPNEQYNPHVTALDNGGMLFTWDTRVTVGFDVVSQEVRGRIYDASGQPISANDFAIAPMSATDLHGLSAITSLQGGGFVVTWQRAANSGTDFEIVGQRYNSSGGTVGAQFQANTQTANSQYGNDVARLSDGGFVVSWVDPGTNNVGGRIVARHYDASGVAIGGEIVIDSKAAGAYGRTVVTALADGGYVVGWIEDDGNNDNVIARAFGSNDVALDAAFEMSFDSPFNGNFFSDGAVTLPNGNVVFAWDGPSITPPGGQSTGQDIYMRVYSFSSSAPGPINGTSGPDVLHGTPGDDVINGLGGDDTLDGDAGADTLVGGQGNDVYYVDNLGDVVTEASGEGRDTVYAFLSYVLTAGSEVEAMSTTDIAGTAAIDLTGNALSQVLYGNFGANVLDGGGGADVMVGFLGDDTYRVDNAGDLIREAVGEGNDTVLASLGYALNAGAEVETLATANDAGTVAIGLTGNEFAQTIRGNAGANALNGAGGADTMIGLAGDDIYYVDDANDVATEAAGQGQDVVYTGVSYTLTAGSSVEVLSARGIGDTDALDLTGNALTQGVWGNDGVNVLDGKGGADSLIGYGGADVFAFTSALGGGNVDRIVDLVSGTDRIALDDAIFTALSPGALAAGAFRLGTAAQDGDDRIVYDQTTGALYYDADGNGAGTQILFATLNAGDTLAASDFNII